MYPTLVKISCGYVEVDSLGGRDIAFYPNKIGQKLNQCVKHANFSCFYKTILWLVSLPQLVVDVGLPRMKHLLKVDMSNTRTNI